MGLCPVFIGDVELLIIFIFNHLVSCLLLRVFVELFYIVYLVRIVQVYIFLFPHQY